MRYERILAAVAATPWAIEPDKGRVIAEILSRRANGEAADETELVAAVALKKDKGKRKPGVVGVIPVYGTITQRADFFSEWSGGTSTEEVGRQLDDFAADPNVEAIVLDVDSPGGSVYGVEELAQKIHATAKQKKVTGVANSEAASAAYWLASQASELVVTPNGQVGSIGVYVMHRDESEALAKWGRKITLISAGERKTAGHPYGPLDDLSRAELQAGVDDYYDKFVKAVARGRNVSQASVREGFGRGGMVRAEKAVKEGMADRIATLEEVLTKYGAAVGPAAQSERPEADSRRRKLLLG